MRAVLAGSYPMLSVRENGSIAIVEGVLQLNENGICVEAFLVRIEIMNLPGGDFPKVYEMGGRIPRKEEYHVNGDGSLCLGVPEQLWMDMKGRFDLLAFIEGPLRSFLLSAREKQRTGKWPHKERAHGEAGIREFYGEWFGTSDPGHVLGIIDVLTSKTIKGHWACPCGSGMPIRKCHQTVLMEMHGMRIPTNVLVRTADVVGSAVMRGKVERADEIERLGRLMQRLVKKAQPA